jgi:protein O-mannosyl-transferase
MFQRVSAATSWHVPIGLALILVATVIVYLPALRGGPVADDPANLTRPELQSFSGLYRIWFEPGATAQYYPLLHSAFWLEYRLWGYSFAGYHSVNVLWHSFSIVLLYLVLTKLKIPGALLASAVFALHPVMVETVGWMTEQKNTLSSALYLGSVWMYLRFDDSRRGVHYFFALLLFASALLAKSATVALPVALLIILWWKSGSLTWRRDVWPLLPFFMLSVASGLMTIWVERKYVGAQGVDFRLDFLQRFLLAGRALWFYLGKLIWPRNMSFTYVRWTIEASEWWQWIYPVAAIGVTFALWAIRNHWRAPLAAWLYYCGTLFPVLGFLNLYMFLYTYVADHLQYLASLGPIAIVSAGVAHVMQRLSIAARRATAACCVVLLATLAALSWQQSHMYGDTMTLYQNTLEHNPDCWIAHHNLGSELEARKQYNEAIEHYKTALRVRPDFAMSHNNLGNALLKLGRYHDAISELDEAARLKPNYGPTHNSLAAAWVALDGHSKAIEQYGLAVKCNSRDAEAHANLAKLLAEAGNANEAVEHFNESIRLRPERADLHTNLGDVLRQFGRHKEAIDHYRSAVQLDPGYLEAYAHLAQSLAASNQSQDAIATAEKAAEVARAAGRNDAVGEFEAWLKRYRTELDLKSPAQKGPQTP